MANDSVSVADRVKKIIVDKLGVDETEITSEANFIQDLGADSLDVVELIMTLEEGYNIIITNDDASELITVGQIVVFIEKQIRKPM